MEPVLDSMYYDRIVYDFDSGDNPGLQWRRPGNLFL